MPSSSSKRVENSFQSLFLLVRSAAAGWNMKGIRGKLISLYVVHRQIFTKFVWLMCGVWQKEMWKKSKPVWESRSINLHLSSRWIIRRGFSRKMRCFIASAESKARTMTIVLRKLKSAPLVLIFAPMNNKKLTRKKKHTTRISRFYCHVFKKQFSGLGAGGVICLSKSSYVHTCV